MRRMLIVTVAIADFASAASAQTAPSPSPTPGPINPTPPQTRPGSTIVINPTEQQCQSGWQPTMQWSKDQFDQFCTKLGASK